LCVREMMEVKLCEKGENTQTYPRLISELEA